ncbi:hypothetical protein C2G38_1415661 [Gigaspora rosea]|uniref:Uncharacterized protein n=1 Tax=Gigaspora rosea TaxID=44941 RepID=A0A397V7I4_9GLOM|nr:hypothetical protein C2G38_1415661 [Gigaspora rosea]
MFRFITFTIFVFSDSQSIQILSKPSTIFLVASIIYNFFMAFLIMCFAASVKFHIYLTLLIMSWVPNEDFIKWFSKYGRVAASFVLLSIIQIDTLKMLKSRIGGLEHFNAPLSDKSLKIIFWGSWFSLFLTEIPQLITQILYVNFSIVEFDLALLSTIVSSLAILSNKVSKLIMKRTYFIK